ncbi:MAG TPA: SUF system Fe-S cluster assembly protein [Alphaproteobacteria bacterium]|nr:SUF system Fe-S cluster assembly protein [Alphaproteobacteria bacterium]
MNTFESMALEQQVIDVLRTCYDPEIPVNIYELGLIYEVKVEPPGVVHVKMTLTAPNCPAAQSLPIEVESKVGSIEGVTDANVEVVWDPPWEPSMMSEAAKLELGML